MAANTGRLDNTAVISLDSVPCFPLGSRRLFATIATVGANQRGAQTMRAGWLDM